MSKFENAMKLMEERCGNDKEELIAVATISLTPDAAGNPRPAARMVCAYYEDGAFFISTDAKKNKMLQIEKNNNVSVGGLNWYTFQGTAENLGWVKDEKNAEIRAKFKKIFNRCILLRKKISQKKEMLALLQLRKKSMMQLQK